MMFAWTRRSVLLGLGGSALTFAAGAARADTRPAPEGAVILTIAGDIAHANRGAIDPKLDGFLAYHDIEFDQAFAFDRAMLEALPQVEFEAQLPEGHEPAVFKGPPLSALLEMAGTAGEVSLVTMALDGYAAELEPGDVEGGDWVLVLSRNGRPLGIGDFGPAMLLQKPKSARVDEDAQWPWAVFYIEVRK